MLCGVAGEGGDDTCASSASFACPSCGGIGVSNCLDCAGYLSTDTEHNICFDRRLFNNFNDDSSDHSDHYHHLWRDLVGMVVWFCAAGVATACGVGGGGIYVPLGIILLNFAPKPSSGLSQASIFGASLGGLLLNLRDLHPNTEIRSSQSSTQTYTRPLIDYDMALFLSPMEMAGAVLGVLIQKILPNWLYLTLAAIILGITARKTFVKYFSTRQKEIDAEAGAAGSAENENESDEGDNTSEENQTRELLSAKEDIQNQPTVEVSAGSDSAAGSTEHATTDSTSTENEDECRRLLIEDSRQYPIEKLGALGILWAGLILLTFLKGGKGVESIVGITCHSPWSVVYFEKLLVLVVVRSSLFLRVICCFIYRSCNIHRYGVLIGIQFIWTLGFASIFGLKLVKRQKVKDSCGYPVLEHDVVWDESKLRFYAFFTFVAGIVAGLIGIGGGMVLGPLMLVMGIHPRVSSATTATMIVLTSSSVAVLFITAGLVPWEYAMFFFGVCFSGALVGKTYIDGYVKRTGKASLLIFLLATIIALATLGCVVIVLIRLNEADWCFDGFHKFCNVAKHDELACPIDRLLFGEGDEEIIQDHLLV